MMISRSDYNLLVATFACAFLGLVGMGAVAPCFMKHRPPRAECAPAVVVPAPMEPAPPAVVEEPPPVIAPVVAPHRVRKQPRPGQVIKQPHIGECDGDPLCNMGPLD